MIVVSLVWVVGGIVSLYEGYHVSSFSYGIYQSMGSLPQYLQPLAAVEVGLGALMVLLGVVQLVFVYGFVSLGRWAQNAALRLALGVFLLFLIAVPAGEWLENSLYGTPLFSLMDEFFVAWSLFYIISTWRYANKQQVWDFLYTEVGPSPSATGGTNPS